MFGSTNHFGQSSNNNPFGTQTQSVFGQNNNANSNPFSPKPFGASTPFGALTGSSMFGGISTGVFGAPQASSSPFGASSQAFWSSTPAFGASSAPAFGSSPSPFGATFAFGQNSFRVSTPQSSTPSFSFGSSPAFGSSSFASTQSPFGAQGSIHASTLTFGGQQGGSRVMLYAPTTEVDSSTSSSQPAGKIQSISSMHVHKEKCHEELRWEDYQRGDKGGQRPSGQSPGGATFGVPNPQPNLFSQSPTFSQTSASSTSTNPFGSTSTSPFGQKTPTPTSNFPSPFGQNTNPSVFGQTPSTTTSGFGSSPGFATTTSHPFGSSSTPGFSSSPLNFGSTSAQVSTPTFNSGLNFNNSQSSQLFTINPSFGQQTSSAFTQQQTSSPFGQQGTSANNTNSGFAQTSNFSTPSTGFKNIFSSSSSLTTSTSPFSQTTPAGLTPPYQSAQPTQPSGAFSFNNFGQTQTGFTSGMGSFSQGKFGLAPAYNDVMQLTPVTNSFGTLPALPQVSIAQGGSSPSIQYGISNMQVMEREQVTCKLLEVSMKLEQSLSQIPFEDLDISDEVREHVELVLSQFRRAKEHRDADDELHDYLHSLCNKASEVDSYNPALESVAKRTSHIRLLSSRTPTRNHEEDDETTESDAMSIYSTESESSGDDDLMRGVRRSEVMKKLSSEYRCRLKKQLLLDISRKNAKKILRADRFEHMLKTIKREKPLRIFDNSEYVLLFWEPNDISEEFLLPENIGKKLKKDAGSFREQGDHDDCWCYALTDMVSASLVIHGHQEEYVPLCVRFLLQNVEKDKYRDMYVFREGVWHRCYGTDIETGLAYVKRHGIPKELPNQGTKIDCCEKRFLGEDEELFKISKILKYTTLEQALVRLRTHPVAATLISFEGWTGSQIYRGPVGGHNFVGYHSVLLVDCLRIKGEIVVIGKMNNGDDVGVEGHKGCIAVSLRVMLSFAGIRRAKKNEGCRSFHVKPTYLLTEFYSVDMEYNNPMHINPMEEMENKKFEVDDSVLYAWMDDEFPDFPLKEKKKKKKKSRKRVRSALKHLKEDRVKKISCCLPYTNKQSTVVQITFPSEPPVVREYDWAKNDLDEFTNDLIIDDALPLYKKDEFKEFVKTQCTKAKKTNEEAQKKAETTKQ